MNKSKSLRLCAQLLSLYIHVVVAAHGPVQNATEYNRKSWNGIEWNVMEPDRIGQVITRHREMGLHDGEA